MSRELCKKYVDYFYASVYYIYMAKTAVTTISLTAEDKKNLRKVKKQFEPTHGKLTITGVIRAMIHLLVRP